MALASWNTTSLCSPGVFANMSLPGATITSVKARIQNLTRDVDDVYRPWDQPAGLVSRSFCNATVSYTHVGRHDAISVEAWLPLNNYAGRMVAVGGSGYVAGRAELNYGAMLGAVVEGAVALTTDAGVSHGPGANAETPASWLLQSPDVVDSNAVDNFASVALNDMAILGKSIAQRFHGQPPAFSYFTGCSEGGRQGLMLAQKYPDAFNGIIAAAPAIYPAQSFAAAHWAQQFMRNAARYPHECELEAITAEAIKTCDVYDGVEDGVISEPERCFAEFDPTVLANNKPILCPQTNTTINITYHAVAVASAVYNGPISDDGAPLWYGPYPGSNFTSNQPLASIGSTRCTANSTCVGVANPLADSWFRFFVDANPLLNTLNLTHAEYSQLFQRGLERYDSPLGTHSANLSTFQNRGGRMLTYHGLADPLIPPKQTERYYRAVLQASPTAPDFYRYFEVPGLAHCSGGAGGLPRAMFAQLREWVEQGQAPDTSPIEFVTPQGRTHARILCPYPQRAAFNSTCGDVAKAGCWECKDADRSADDQFVSGGPDPPF